MPATSDPFLDEMQSWLGGGVATQPPPDSDPFLAEMQDWLNPRPPQQNQEPRPSLPQQIGMPSAMPMQESSDDPGFVIADEARMKLALQDQDIEVLTGSPAIAQASVYDIVRRTPVAERAALLDAVSRRAASRHGAGEYGFGRQLTEGLARGAVETSQDFKQALTFARPGGASVMDPVNVSDEDADYARRLLAAREGADPLINKNIQDAPEAGFWDQVGRAARRWPVQASEMAYPMAGGMAATVANPLAGVAYWTMQEYPDQVSAMRQEGIAPNVAKPLALIFSSAIGASELIEPFPGFSGNATLKNGFRRYLSERAVEIARSYTKELGEEGIQGALRELSMSAGRWVDENAPQRDPQATRAFVESIQQAAGPMLVMMAPGAMARLGRDALSNNQKPEQTGNKPERAEIYENGSAALETAFHDETGRKPEINRKGEISGFTLSPEAQAQADALKKTPLAQVDIETLTTPEFAQEFAARNPDAAAAIIAEPSRSNVRDLLTPDSLKRLKRRERETLAANLQSALAPAPEATDATEVQEQTDAAPAEAVPETVETTPLKRGRVAAVEQVEAKWGHPHATVPRPDPAPLPGGSKKKLSELIVDLGEAVKRKIETTAQRNVGPGGIVMGSYWPGSAKTSIRYEGDLDTAAHEVGHALDDAFGIVSPWIGAPSGFDTELIPLGYHGSASPKSPLATKQVEGVAEWIRAWLFNPNEAKMVAPKFAARFNDAVPPDVQAKLRTWGDDIRRLLGSSAETQTLANINTGKPKSVFREKWDAAFKPTGTPEFKTTFLDRAKVRLSDSKALLWKAMKAAQSIRGIEELDPSKDPKKLIRLLAGSQTKINEIFESGLIDSEGEKVTGGGLDWLIDPADKATTEKMDRDIEGAFALAVSDRVVEKAAQVDKAVLELAKLDARRQQVTAAMQTASGQQKHLLEQELERINKAIQRERNSIGYRGPLDPEYMTGWAEHHKGRLAGTGAGIKSDFDLALDTVSDLKKDPARYNRLREISRRIRVWHDGLLRYLVEKGRISESMYAAIKSRNMSYVSFARVLDRFIDNPLERFKGSTKMIENPLVSLMRQTATLIRDADRNEATRSIADLLTSDRKGMHRGKVQNLASIGWRGTAEDKDTIKVYRDGKPEYWKFQADLHKTIKGLTENESMTLPEKVFSFPAQIMRGAVTNAPGFIIRNVIRDPFNRAVFSESGSKPHDVLKGYSAEEMREFNVTGGGQFGNYSASPNEWNRQLQSHIKHLAKDGRTVFSTIADIGHGYHNLATKSEAIGRISEWRAAYKKAIAEGMDEYDARIQASYEARSVLDYAVAGDLVKMLNRYIPFTNAAVQGLIKSARAVRDNPARYFARIALLTLPLSFIEYAWNAQGPDDEKRYWALPSWRRDLFWNFKVGPGFWLSIPKPFELGIPASAMSRLISHVRGDENAGDGFIGSVWRSLVPFDDALVGGPFKALTETVMNYDMFRNRNPIPNWEQRLDVSRREGTERASAIGRGGQAISQGVADIIGQDVAIDARKIDFFIQQQFGGLGQIATSATNIRGNTDAVRLASNILGVFSMGPGTDAEPVKRAFRAAEKRGKTSTKEMKKLIELRREYLGSDSMKDRERIADDMIDEAKRILEGVEAGVLLQDKPKKR